MVLSPLCSLDLYSGACIVAALLLGFRIFQLLRQSVHDSPCSESSVVVITGCDTGFGRGLAERLHHTGWIVVAGCLTEEQRKNLAVVFEGSDSIATLLDVTDSASIAALRAVTDGVTTRTGQRLRAVVCNAGILDGFVADATDMATWRRVLDVNFFGVVETAKGFMDAIMEQQARVVVVTSVISFISVPGFGAYGTSKHAARAFVDTLRRELRPWGVPVCNIQPGVMRTPLVCDAPSQLAGQWAKYNAGVQHRWGLDWFERFQRRGKRVAHIGGDPVTVVNTLEHSVTCRYPKKEYLVGWDAYLLYYPLSLLPTVVGDWVFSIMWMGNPPATAPGGESANREKED